MSCLITKKLPRFSQYWIRSSEARVVPRCWPARKSAKTQPAPAVREDVGGPTQVLDGDCCCCDGCTRRRRSETVPRYRDQQVAKSCGGEGISSTVRTTLHDQAGGGILGTSSANAVDARAISEVCTLAGDSSLEREELTDVGCADDNNNNKEVLSMPPPTTPPEQSGSGSSTSLPLPQHHHTVLALYHFQLLEDPEQMRTVVDRFLRNRRAVGGIIIASEGINGTLSYPTPTAQFSITHDTQATGRSADSGVGEDRSEGGVAPVPPEDDSERSASAATDNNNYNNNVDDDDDGVLAFFQQTFPGIRVRVSHSTDGPVFFRLRVRCKAEIVTLGVPQLVPLLDVNVNDNHHNHNGGIGGGTASTSGGDAATSLSGETLLPVRVGQRVAPRDWNTLVRDPTTWLIDARNDYEVQVGTFVGSDNPSTTTFTEWPEWIREQWNEKMRQRRNDPTATPLPSRIAMFCTGGVRCEKATAYCHNVVGDLDIPIYHLEGGILAYFDEIPPNDSLFQGECYVFDRRVAVTHGLRPSQQYTSCHACRHPLTPSDLTHPAFDSGISCPHCAENPEKQLRRDRYVARERQMRLASDLGIVHLGSTAGSGTGCTTSSSSTATPPSHRPPVHV